MADLVTVMCDGAVDVEGWTESRVVEKVAAVCHPHVLTAAAVSIFPRRLSSATADERAADRKLARKVGHRLNLVVPGATWQEVKDEARADHEARQRAAVVVWERWLPVVGAELHDLQVFCATWVVRQNLLALEVRKMVSRLEYARKVIR